MTREEKLQQAADIFSEDHKYEENLDFLSMRMAFEAGVKWADRNPDLSSLWHDASEEPICDKRLLLLHTNSAVSIFEYTGKISWSMLISCGICQYAYISDLLPKGGKL